MWRTTVNLSNVRTTFINHTTTTTTCRTFGGWGSRSGVLMNNDEKDPTNSGQKPPTIFDKKPPTSSDQRFPITPPVLHEKKKTSSFMSIFTSAFGDKPKEPSEDDFLKIFDVDNNKKLGLQKKLPITPEKPTKDSDDVFSALISLLDEKTFPKKEEKPESLFPKIQLSQEEEIEEPPVTHIVERLFGSPTTKKKLRLDELAYWDIYPFQIKKWVVFTKTVRGYYDRWGKWIQVQALENLLNLADEPTPVDTQDTTKYFESLFEKEQSELPLDLRGFFRFGVTYDEIKDFHPKIRRAFSFKFATQREILNHRKKLAIQKWKMHDFDTASEPIQVDILTQRVRSLQNHLRKNKQDKKNMRALQLLVKRRKKLMQRLKKRDIHTYFAVLREIKLPDLHHVWDMRARYP